MSISDNIKRIQDEIAAAAAHAGRRVEDIKLMAVTKYVEVARIAEAADAGLLLAGENRVQEFLEKEEFFKARGFTVNLIGQLQSNKVKYVTGKVALIQSVDRLSLAREIDRHALARGICQDVLLEVNIGEEPQKGGVLPGELEALLDEIAQQKGVCVKGLMCVPPAAEGEARTRGYFAKLRELAERIGSVGYPNVAMDELSMGMSADFALAIAEGSTMVRVGRGIFGSRSRA